MADGMEVGTVALEPELVPLLSQASQQPIDPEQLPSVLRAAVKTAVLADTPDIAPKLAAHLASLSHDHAALDDSDRV